MLCGLQYSRQKDDSSIIHMSRNFFSKLKVKQLKKRNKDLPIPKKGALCWWMPWTERAMSFQLHIQSIKNEVDYKD